MLGLKFNKAKARRAAVAAAFLACAYTGQNNVGVDQFGMRVSLWKVDPALKDSGFKVFVPLFQYVHSYQTNLQRVEFNAGSCRFFPGCDSTDDHNPATARIVLNYRVKRDVEQLSLHRWSMDGWMLPDGYWLMTSMANDSANSVFGRRAMAASLANPDQFLKDFKEDLVNRLAQNKVPVDIESVELKNMRTILPTTTTQNVLINKPGM